MHFEEAYKAMKDGKVVTIYASYSGSTFGEWRIRNHKLEFRRDPSEEWKLSMEPLTSFMVQAFKLVE